MARMNSRNPGFWVVLAVSEIVFGLGIFFATRAYYLAQGTSAAAAPVAAVPAWPGTGNARVAGSATPAAGNATGVAPAERSSDVGRSAAQMLANLTQ